VPKADQFEAIPGTASKRSSMAKSSTWEDRRC
jgi:hypothetical protein